MIHFVLLVSRQGKVRLAKWYSPYTLSERSKVVPIIMDAKLNLLRTGQVIRELSGIILNRGPKLCNFVEWRGFRVVYRRYAGLYFCMCVDEKDNELEVLDIIHHYVEILDRYFGSVCELDLIFNFHKHIIEDSSSHLISSIKCVFRDAGRHGFWFENMITS
ncbi:AP-1 complex subunit sigma-1 isoform X4 [Populus trichocarpa]|uniref:AP-1 complex subunit sigma-1 isoform X4 n=1 Tax=Populus trichocarpa TaxID=3694 RepID=UPI002279DF23|nr:AP-1 complex subunit sigma-1 isoform X4 [Populus trichocarpa]